MKKQKPARLFRALIVSSTLSGVATHAWAQEGVATPGGGNASDGVASPGAAAVPPAIPQYDLPQYIPQFGNETPDWFPRGGRRGRSWQDEIGPRYRFETRIGESLGVDDEGDGAINVMVPFRADGSNLIFFVDGRGTVTYNGQGGASAGIGARYFDESANRIFGLSGWVDYDAGNSQDYTQVGLSLESLGKWIDVRINGYLPVTKETNVLSTQFGNAQFLGNGVFIERRDRIESAFAGLSAEIGGPLPILGRYGFEGYVGGYYYQSDDSDSASGVSTRFEANVTDDLRLGINVSHDEIFDTQVFGTVSLSLPDGRPQSFFRPRTPEERLLSRTERRSRAIVNRRTKSTLVNGTGMMVVNGAINGNNAPNVGLPVSNIVVVRPQNGVNGVGTFEDPLNTLVGFKGGNEGTLFLVDTGNVNGKVTLLNNSRIFSFNYLNGNNVLVNSPAGPIALPTDYSPNAQRPVWSNPTGGTLVTIAGNNTEIAGIIFDGTTSGAAIPNSTLIAGSNFQGFRIHDNEFRNYTRAIDFNNVTGTIANNNPGVLYSNLFYGTSGVSERGFSLTNSGPGTLDLEVGSTEFALLASEGAALGNIAYGNTGEDKNGNGLLDAGEDRNANGMLDTGIAFEITARNRAVINANVRGNVTLAEDLNRDGALLTEDLNRNNLLDPGEDANGNNVLDYLEDLNRNGLLDAGNSQGFVFTAGASQSVINLRMVENLAGDNVGAGIVLSANGSTINAATIGEDVNGNGLLDGYEDANRNGRLDPGEDLNGNNRLDFGEDLNEDSDGNGRLATSEDLNGDKFLNLGNRNGRLDGGQALVNNIVIRNGGDGVLVLNTNNGNVNLRMVGNQVGQADDRSTGNAGIGLNIQSDSGNVITNLGFLYNEDSNFNGLLDAGEDTNANSILDSALAIHGNEFVANRGGGINLNFTDTAIGQINAIGNTIEGIGGGALGFLVTNNAAGTPYVMANNSIAGMNITNISWNVAAAGLQFNTDVVNGGAAFSVATNANGVDTGTLTGLQTVNGKGQPYTVANLATSLALKFNNFNPVNGLLDTGEDTNANTKLDLSEDLNGNGRLDAGEDTNGNGLLDAGEDLGEQFLFTIDLDTAGNLGSAVTPAQLIGSIVDVTFSSQQKLRGVMQAVPGNPAQAQFVPTVNDLGLGQGLQINASDTASLGSSLLLNNRIANFGGSGVTAQAQQQGNISNLTIRGNNILGNGVGNGVAPFAGSGLSFITNNGVGGNSIINAVITNNVIRTNTLAGISANALGGSMTFSRIEDNVIDANGSGIQLAAAQAASLNARISTNEITNNIKPLTDNDTVSTNDALGDGVYVLADAATITLNELRANTVTGNAGDGFNLDVRNSGTLRVTPSEDRNFNGVLDPGEDVNEDLNNNGQLDAGEDLNSDGFLNLGNGNGLLDRGVLDNQFQNNLGVAFSATGTGSQVAPSILDLGDIRNTSIVTNTNGTGNFAIVASNTAIRANFYGNSVLGDSANNPAGGPGLLVSATGGSYEVIVGNSGLTNGQSNGNIFEGNRGAGVALTLSDTGTGRFVIENNTITRIADDKTVNTPYSGDGIAVSLVGSSNLIDATAVLTRSNITGNVIGDFTNANLGTAGSGIAILASERTIIQDLLIDNNKIGQAGNDNSTRTTTIFNGVTFVDGDRDGGIRVDRLDDARFDVVNPRPGDLRAVNIRDNEVRNNRGAVAGANPSPVNGLFINVMNGIRDDVDFDIRNNVLSGNSGNGAQFETQADASLATDLRGNVIENNTLNGILTTGVENVAEDLETQGGTWIQNTIRGNTLNGIQISGVSGDVVELIVGQLGNDPVTGLPLGNLIENNGVDGIQITSGGLGRFNQNIIRQNGRHGFHVDSVSIGFRADELINNSIVNNGGDGIQWRHSGGDSSELGVLIATGNNIDSNAGRGVDILNQGISTANIRFGDGTAAGANSITSNGLEGFYVVATASFTQTNTADSSTPLAANGSVIFSSANVVLDLNRNEISANNNSGDFIGGGVVLRIGTMLGGGGAFSQADATGTVGGVTSVGTNDALFGNGRTNARIINNTFEGNLGDDVYIESFVSTVDPVQSNGTWDAMAFTTMAYQSDPLARLNLVFRGNTGNSLNVTTGEFDRSAAPGQSANVGAFYNNAEDTFKSRLNNATPPGAFTQAGRRRNAQRIPARDSLLPDPLNSPEFGFYEYPGVGPSTFRVESDFDVSGFTTSGVLNGDGFGIDLETQAPYGNFSPNQVPFRFPTTFGEQDFGWGTAAPGTFGFDAAFQNIFP